MSKDAPELGYIPALSLFSDDPEDKRLHRELAFQRGVEEQQKVPTPASQIETGSELNFNVKILRSERNAHIYQITAREEENHALYWLAIDDTQAGGQTLFSMTKLASNGETYQGCHRSRTEDSAAEIRVLPGKNFRAFIDVEPAHTTSETEEGFEQPTNENGENADAECPYSVHLEWNHKEWATNEPKKKCPDKFSPRDIKISDDGTVTASPATVQTAGQN